MWCWAAELRRVLAAALALGAGLAAACDLDYQITVKLDEHPRHLAVRLSFDAGGRSATGLRLAPSWAGVDDFASHLHGWRGEAGAVPEPAGPNRWQVRHASEGRVVLHYQVHAALAEPDQPQPQPQEQLYRTQAGADWVQFFGHGALVDVDPWGDDTRPRICIRLAGLPAGAPVVSSHGLAQPNGPGAWGWQFQGPPFQARHAFYAAGPGWRLASRAIAGGPLHVAQRGAWPFDVGRLADAAAALIDTQRRFWGAEPAPPMLLALTPNHQEHNSGGTLVHNAAVLHGPGSFVPGEGVFQFLVAHENLHQWLPRRFGAMGTGLAAARDYWFSEGFTDYYTHRLLLAAGLWSRERYAAELTSKIRRYLAEPAHELPNDEVARQFFSRRELGQLQYQRGEFLALRWDAALRARGHPGLDEVMRTLLLPEGSGGNQLAVQRLLAALRPLLGELPQRDLVHHVERGRRFDFADDGLLGPCFMRELEPVHGFELGFDPASLQARQVRGVVPGSAAHAAGLRDGMLLQGWSLHHGDTSRPVQLWVGTAGSPPRELTWLPRAAEARLLPRWRERVGASADSACVAWQQR